MVRPAGPFIFIRRRFTSALRWLDDVTLENFNPVLYRPRRRLPA